jgi:hypothetical protein
MSKILSGQTKGYLCTMILVMLADLVTILSGLAAVYQEKKQKGVKLVVFSLLLACYWHWCYAEKLCTGYSKMRDGSTVGAQRVEFLLYFKLCTTAVLALMATSKSIGTQNNSTWWEYTVVVFVFTLLELSRKYLWNAEFCDLACAVMLTCLPRGDVSHVALFFNVGNTFSSYSPTVDHTINIFLAWMYAKKTVRIRVRKEHSDDEYCKGIVTKVSPSTMTSPARFHIEWEKNGKLCDKGETVVGFFEVLSAYTCCAGCKPFKKASEKPAQQKLPSVAQLQTLVAWFLTAQNPVDEESDDSDEE